MGVSGYKEHSPEHSDQIHTFLYNWKLFQGHFFCFGKCQKFEKGHFTCIIFTFSWVLLTFKSYSLPGLI